ncbi:MAG: twin-arginine translocase subunit TatC [Planctomycetota bacterium]
MSTKEPTEATEPDPEPEKKPQEEASQGDSKKEPKSEQPSGAMSFAGHLDELRKRLFLSLIVVGLVFMVGWMGFAPQLKAFFLAPHQIAAEALANHDPPVVIDTRLQVLSPLEDVFFTLKVSLLVALLVGLPFLLYQTWAFIAEGLYKKEKKAVFRYLPFSMLFAFAGMIFGYTFMIPTILEFLYALPDPELVIQNYRLQDYFSLFLMFTFALALIFQLPILMMGLGSLGLVDAKFFRKYRRHFILVAFVLGAMLTPPEPFSQLLMATPTILLYELGILLVVMAHKRQNKAKAS